MFFTSFIIFFCQGVSPSDCNVLPFFLALPIHTSHNSISIQRNEAEAHSLKTPAVTYSLALQHLPFAALTDGFIYQNHIWFQFSACLTKHVQLCGKRSLHNVFCLCNLEERALTILSLKSNCTFSTNN